MKSIILGFFIGIALLLSGCNSGNRNQNTDTAHTHEHIRGNVHDHQHENDHEFKNDEGQNHVDDHNNDVGHLHTNDVNKSLKKISSENDEKFIEEIYFTRKQAEAVNLQLEVIKPSLFNYVIKTSGQVEAAQGDEMVVVATSNGIVSFTNPSIADGTPVSAGQSLITISAKELLEGDPATKAKMEYETALKEYQRAESLVRDQIISDKEFEQIRLRFNTAKTVYEAQSSKMTQGGVKVTAPINGYIKNRMVAQGEYVSVGQPIATIAQNRRLQLRAEVSESYFKLLKNITTAHFKPSYDDNVYKLTDLNGRLLSFGKAADQQSFYIPVTFEFDNVGDILPGAYAEVFLMGNPQKEIISVPISSVTEEQGLYFVYLQLDEEGYTRQEVELGQSNGERVEVLSGLKEGDKVVTKGVYQVKLAAVSSVMPEGHSHSH